MDHTPLAASQARQLSISDAPQLSQNFRLRGLAGSIRCRWPHAVQVPPPWRRRRGRGERRRGVARGLLQRPLELVGRLEPPLAVPLQRLVQGRPQRHRHVALAVEPRVLPGQREPQRPAQRVDVRPVVHLRGVDLLLRRAVTQAEQLGAGQRHLLVGGALLAGEAEVAQLRLFLGGEQDVGRLHVAVDHAVLVRVGRAALHSFTPRAATRSAGTGPCSRTRRSRSSGGLGSPAHPSGAATGGASARHLPARRRRRGGGAGDVLHDEARPLGVILHRVEGDDVDVQQAGDGAGLGEEPGLEAGVGRELFGQPLERDVPPGPQVAGEVDRAHAAAADEAEDLVPARAGGGRAAGEAPREAPRAAGVGQGAAVFGLCRRREPRRVGRRGMAPQPLDKPVPPAAPAASLIVWSFIRVSW